MSSTLISLDPDKHYFRSRVIAEKGFISDAIKIFSRSAEATHVDIITLEGTYIGARAEGGVQERPANYCEPVWERRYAIECTEEQAAGIVSDARAAIGEKYDYLDIFGLMIEHDIHSLHRSICSQFAFEHAWKNGIELLNVLPYKANLVSPEMYHLSNLFIGRCYYELGVSNGKS